MAYGRVLVTGGSQGIGRAIAEGMLAEGWGVVATCRAPEKLSPADRLDGVTYLPFEATDPQSTAELARQAGEVDVLINNAGASPLGPAEEAGPEKVRELFQLNLFSSIQLTQAVLAGMRERRQGTVIFIGSMRSEAPSPFSSLYSASKAAIRAFAECLRMEVAEYGIKVCVVAPTFIRTGLGQTLVMKPDSPYAAAVARVGASRARQTAAASAPAVVARTVLSLLRARNPRPLSFTGRFARVQGFLARHLPRGVVAAIMARRFDLAG